MADSNNPLKQQRERIKKLEGQLEEARQDRARYASRVAGLQDTATALQSRLQQQQIEMLLQDMGAPRNWAELYLRSAMGTGLVPLPPEERPPLEPTELDLADWIRRLSGAESVVTKPLPVHPPVRLHLVSAQGLTEGGAKTENSSRLG
jgi:hypothetical protein